MQPDREPHGAPAERALLRAIVALADECRATSVAADARCVSPSRDELEWLCRRLRHHVFEHVRALSRTRQDTTARLKSVALARAATARAIAQTLPGPDGERAALAQYLTAERTKFVMRVHVDAMHDLTTRLAQLERLSREEAIAMAQRQASELLGGLWNRLVPEVQRVLARFATHVRSDMDVALADLGEGMPEDAWGDLARVPISAFREEVESRIPTLVPPLLGRLSLRRDRIELAARDELEHALGHGAVIIATRLLQHHDAGRSRIEARFHEIADGIEVSIVRAGELAENARRMGNEGVAHARGRLLAWNATIARFLEGP